MDRISALRTIETALTEFESGQSSLPELETEVRGTLRTYATEFDDRTPYRASGSAAVEGLVVLAPSAADARDRVDELTNDAHRIEVEPLD